MANKFVQWLDESSVPVFVKKLIAYLGVGGIAAIVDVTFFSLAKYVLDLHYLPALICGFIPGMTTNFLICNQLLFYRMQRSVLAAYWRHILASLLSLLVNMLVMFVIIQIFQWRYYVFARVIAIGVGFMVSFLGIRYYAFRDNWFYRE